MQILKIILIIIVAFIILFIIVGYALSSQGHSGLKTDHFDGKKFINLTGAPTNGLAEVFKFMTTREPEPWSKYLGREKKTGKDGGYKCEKCGMLFDTLPELCNHNCARERDQMYE